ncbi:ribonuclease [Sphingomonas rubra]|nr:ribonuclease [Sphingomonas rubra]
MIEWLFEAGIGEARAALVEGERILVAAIEPDDAGPLVGLVSRARLVERLPARRGRATLDNGAEILVSDLPPALTQGAALMVEITREAIFEAGRAKPPQGRPSDAPPAPAPDLLARLVATGHPVRHLRAHEPDLLERAGWSELLEEAATGDIAFAGGALRMSPTPAMTLFDVDGAPPVDALALAAAPVVAAAILRHGIGGSIGVDFPTVEGKAARLAVAAAIDAALPPPFERTAMNGFGFLQIVRPRPRASLPERVRATPTLATARAALRRIEREPAGAPRAHALPAPVHAALLARPHWLAELARRTGVVHQLEPA